MSYPARQPAFLIAVAKALRFYSRLPVPRLPGEARAGDALDLAAIAPAVPVAGAIIGAVAALTLALALGLGLGDLVAAVSAVACGIAVTGALHEDGLADTADGFFAEAGIERRLEIMRDSRLGSFGVLALILAVLLRVGLLAELSLAGAGAAAAALIGAAALSRAAGLMPLVLLSPARRDGAGAAAGRLPVPAFTHAAMIGCGIALLPALLAGFGLWRGLIACLAAFASSRAICALAEVKVGGQTGDVAGAAQIVGELAVYLVLATGSGGR
ncbi:MAG: adenosylcobinamide-GDP ribazoletransferase [Hyphomicrobiales bacterium]